MPKSKSPDTTRNSAERKTGGPARLAAVVATIRACQNSSRSRMSLTGLQGALAGLVAASTFGRAQAAEAPADPFSYAASVSVKELYDSNVYMQKVSPIANQGSLVTIATPALSGSYKPSAAFNATISYAPDVAFYHSESSEDYVAHKGNVNFSGKLENATWELLNGITWIDGNNLGPTFFGPGGAPALGGVPLRDRRDMAVYRTGFKYQHNFDNWFLRPVAGGYHQDFQTEHRASAPGAAYLNLVDRNDFNGGIDVGYRATTNLFVTAGYRYGQQGQSTALAGTVEYSNSYHRFLAGLEGKITDWLKISGSIGPDLRDFGPNVAPGFDDDKTKLFVDATITITPTPSDTITFVTKRFEQPGYGGGSVYEDIAYDLSWRHKFNDKLATTLGVRALNWDVEDPVLRNEWWYNINAGVSYAFNKNLSAEAGYSFDQVESNVPNTAGREAQRHIASIGVKYVF